MEQAQKKTPGSVLFIPHGGGPLPLLGDEGHREMVAFLKSVTTKFSLPSAIVVISAHWEEDIVTITSGQNPSLIYDYYGFPEASYEIKYPAPGAPDLARQLYERLHANGIASKMDDQRGFDHGLFVPLKIMFPDASIPCVQVSLVNNLSPEAHIKTGEALAGLMDENVLVLGSGFSFHNLRAFFSQTEGALDDKNEAFEDWLVETCTNKQLSEPERTAKLIAWENAPYARYCHPREEHLLPLHVCYGIAGAAAECVFDGKVIGKRATAYLWQ